MPHAPARLDLARTALLLHHSRAARRVHGETGVRLTCCAMCAEPRKLLTLPTGETGVYCPRCGDFAEIKTE